MNRATVARFDGRRGSGGLDRSPDAVRLARHVWKFGARTSPSRRWRQRSGFVFAAYSTYDYAAQLDRQVHAVHCSFILVARLERRRATCARRPSSAPTRQSCAQPWGGVPVSLFAMGTFAFFAFGAYLSMAARVRRGEEGALVLRGHDSRASGRFDRDVHGDGSAPPWFCKLCVGIYASSLVLTVSATLAWRAHGRERSAIAPGGGLAHPCSGSRGLASPAPCLRSPTSRACPTTGLFLDKCSKPAVKSEARQIAPPQTAHRAPDPQRPPLRGPALSHVPVASRAARRRGRLRETRRDPGSLPARQRA